MVPLKEAGADAGRDALRCAVRGDGLGLEFNYLTRIAEEARSCDAIAGYVRDDLDFGAVEGSRRFCRRTPA